MKVGDRYYDEAGFISGGSGIVRLRDLESGDVFDWGSHAWSAFPVIPDGTLTEDSGDAGYYPSEDVDIAGWGTRRVGVSTLLTKDGKAPQAREQTLVVLGGVEAVSVNVAPSPAGQVNAILMVRTGSGGIPVVAPSAYCHVEGATIGDYGPAWRTGTWDPDSGAMAWSVPENSFCLIGCQDTPFCGLYAFLASDVLINSATPID